MSWPPIISTAPAVDARAVPPDLIGLRTFFNSFHHFAHADARAILSDAVRSRQPIGIFEIPDRALRTVLSVGLLTPLMVALATPFRQKFAPKVRDES